MTLSVLDDVFIGLSCIICVFSFFTGFLKRISGLLAAIVAVFALKIALEACEINQLFTNNLHRCVICVALFLILYIVVKLIVKKAAKGISDTAVIGTADKLLGFICGLAISLALIVLASFVIYYAKPALADESVIIKTILQIIQ